MENLSKTSFGQMTTDEKIDLFVPNYRVPQKRSKEEALEMLRSKMNTPAKSSKKRKLLPYLSAAASVALIALISTLYWYYSPARIVANLGEHLERSLPDGSNVTLNADSRITYSKSRFTSERTLNLTGEAYFSVQKGKPFVINTPNGKVEVLGTTLNVFSRSNTFHVSCLTGVVRVAAGNSVETIYPGEKVELVSGVLQKTGKEEANQAIGWTVGQFHFESMPLISTFEEIERQFNVKITTNDIRDRFFTGHFENKDVKEVMDIVCSVMNLTYEVKDGSNITVKTKSN